MEGFRRSGLRTTGGRRRRRARGSVDPAPTASSFPERRNAPAGREERIWQPSCIFAAAPHATLHPRNKLLVRRSSPASRGRSRAAAAEERKANPAMGQGLSNIEAWQLKWNTPQSISKYTERQENVRIKYALSSMQGLCPYMEDAHAAIPDLDGARTTSFFGVYDGHGGANVAKYCAEKVHTELLLNEGYPNDLGNALGRVFSRIDVQLKEYDDFFSKWGISPASASSDAYGLLKNTMNGGR